MRTKPHQTQYVMRSYHASMKYCGFYGGNSTEIKQQKQKSIMQQVLQEAAKGFKTHPMNESMKKTFTSFVLLSDKDHIFW